MSVEQLGTRIVGLAGRLSAATCRWLSHYCALSRRTAIEHVRVARALAAHPVLVESMSAGRLSYSKARAISRLVSRGDAGLIHGLVMVAEHGTISQLEDVVRGLRTADDNAGDDLDRGSADERLTTRWRDDSSLGLSARLEAEHGALVDSAIQAVARYERITPAQALIRMPRSPWRRSTMATGRCRHCAAASTRR